MLLQGDKVMINIKELDIKSHKRVVAVTDETTGLDSIVAIHNTNLGTALGGCRAMTYESGSAALNDALNLSKGMTYKNSLAGLDLGGGKSVINLNGKVLTDDMLKSFAEGLNEINKDGREYVTAGDIGTNTDHLITMRKYTEFVNGHIGSDSGIATAFGVFQAMKAAVEFKGQDIKDQIVSVLGYGKVGSRLTNFLIEAGAHVIVSDIANPFDDGRLEHKVGTLGRGAVGTAHLNGTVFAPCATGGALNGITAPNLPVGHVVVGGANNQLADETISRVLEARDILYVPDYLSNSGGVIIVNTKSEELEDLEYDDPRVHNKLLNIGNVTTEVLTRSVEEGLPTAEIADKIAEERFNGFKQVN